METGSWPGKAYPLGPRSTEAARCLRLGPIAARLRVRRSDVAQRQRLGCPLDARRGHQPVPRLGRRSRAEHHLRRTPPAPNTTYADTTIYEAHVRGLTMTHPGIPDDQRGTYAALAHPVMIEHYERIGVTAIELMPVHQFVHDSMLVERGLRNYWGYNTIAFFAPHNGYSSVGDLGQQVQEFKAMVRSLHQAGIEVLLDVCTTTPPRGTALAPPSACAA